MLKTMCFRVKPERTMKLWSRSSFQHLFQTCDVSLCIMLILAANLTQNYVSLCEGKHDGV